MGIPRCRSGKESVFSPKDRRDFSLILGSERSPGGGHGNSLQYFCLVNHMDRGAGWATVYRATELDMNDRVTRSQHTEIILRIEKLFISKGREHIFIDYAL